MLPHAAVDGFRARVLGGVLGRGDDGYDRARGRLPLTGLPHASTAPLTGPIGELNGEARAAFERDIVTGSAGWSADGGLVYGQPILTTSART